MLKTEKYITMFKNFFDTKKICVCKTIAILQTAIGVVNYRPSKIFCF